MFKNQSAICYWIIFGKRSGQKVICLKTKVQFFSENISGTAKNIFWGYWVSFTLYIKGQIRVNFHFADWIPEKGDVHVSLIEDFGFESSSFYWGYFSYKIDT